MYQEFEQQVKEKLKENKLKEIKPSSQVELAEMLDITPPYLSDILKGYRVGIKQRNEIKEILNLEEQERIQMITSVTKDGTKYSNPKEVDVPKKTCEVIYKNIKL